MNPRIRRLALALAGCALLVTAFSASAQRILIDGNPSPSVPLNTTPPRPVNGPAVLVGTPGYLLVNTDNLSLRSGPDARFSLIGVLDGGTRLIALGSNGVIGDGRWWFVEVGELHGWVTDEFVVIRGDLRNLPVVEPAGEIARPSFYIGGLNPLYPNRFGNALCLVGGGLFYRAIGVDSTDPSWVQIEADCGTGPVTGWVQFDRGLLRNTGELLLPVVNF